MKIIVLTGGTCGGKSTIIKKLKQRFKNKLVIVPEVATLLFEKKFSRPKMWTIEWHHSLQRAILKKQYELEEKAKKLALQKNAKWIIYDRALLDPAAYIEGGIEELQKKFNINKEKTLKRYDLIIHLESLSTLNPNLYSKMVSSNHHRIESVKEAKKQERETKKAWEGHPNIIYLSGNIEKNFKNIVEIMQDCEK